MGMFKRSSRTENRLRMALAGPAGSGKTYTALTFAFAIAEGARIAVIDTEHGSASLYSGEHGWTWDSVELESFAPSTYSACLRDAARAGYRVVVIDSLSHAWSGTGGALSQVDRAAGRSGGTFAAWRDVTPQHDEMINTILAYPGHVIATLRSKMEYALEPDDRGKTQVKKLGLKPIQREGVDYEFSIVCDIDTDHRLTVSKTRFAAIDGMIVHKPGPSFMIPIIWWLKEGSGGTDGMNLKKKKDDTTGEALAREIKDYWRSLGWSAEKLRSFLAEKGAKKVEELPRVTGKRLLARLVLLDGKKQADKVF